MFISVPGLPRHSHQYKSLSRFNVHCLIELYASEEVSLPHGFIIVFV